MNPQKPKKTLTREQAIHKMYKYCAYQERCQLEAKQKLAELGFYGLAADEIISVLIAEGFLDELRFAIAFAGGKFRVKGWGINKITHALKALQISDVCIKLAIKEIDQSDYETRLKQMIEKQLELYQKKHPMNIAKQKVIQYCLIKGYGIDLIKQYLALVS